MHIGIDMTDRPDNGEPVHAFYSEAFTCSYKKLFRPLSLALIRMGVTPNAVTVFSFLLAVATGALIAYDYLWTAIVFGLAMGFSDTIDGQIAKESGNITKFGGVLDSVVDRYNEFVVFLGFAVRYYFHQRYPWIVLCALAFLGSIMTSYIKSRAESEGFDCKVGRLQRPERLTIIGFGTLFRSVGVDIMIVFLAVATQATSLYRLFHVYRQSRAKQL